MRFVKSKASPFILKLTQKGHPLPFEEFNYHCYIISSRFLQLNTQLHNSFTFPTEQLKDLITQLLKLKKHIQYLPNIRIPFDVLSALDKMSLKEFFKEKSVELQIEEGQFNERRERETKFYNSLCNLNLRIE